MPLTMPLSILISLGIVRQSATSEAFCSSGQFDAVPEEIVENILVRLPPRNLVPTLRLNRKLNAIILNSTQLQYHLALCAYGMVDGSSSMSAKDKLAELIGREDEAWRKRDISKHVSIPVPQNQSQINGISNGTVFGDVNGSGALTLLDLSANSLVGSPNDTDFWRNIALPGVSRTIDVSLAVDEHDLMCITTSSNLTREFVVHLRQHSTGLPHSLAVNPEIHTGVLLPDYDQDDPFVRVEVAGPYMVMLFTVGEDDDVVLLINWWKGEIIKREECPGPLTYDGFAFLTHDLLLLANGHYQLIDIVKLPAHNEQERGMFRRIACLHFPEPIAFNGSISCSSAPNPIGARHPTKLEAASSRHAFKTDPEHAIVVMRLSDNVKLIVHRKALVTAVNAHVARHPNPGGEALHLSWAEWTLGPGRGSVRWIRDKWDSISTNFGQRLVEIRDGNHLSIMDFNPYAVERARASLAAAGIVSVPEIRTNIKFRGEIKSLVSSAPSASQQDGVLWLSDWSYMRVIEGGVSLSRMTEDNGELPYVETVTKLVDDCYQDVFLDGERLICRLGDLSGEVKYVNVYSM